MRIDDKHRRALREEHNRNLLAVGKLPVSSPKVPVQMYWLCFENHISSHHSMFSWRCAAPNSFVSQPIVIHV